MSGIAMKSSMPLEHVAIGGGAFGASRMMAGFMFVARG